MIRYMENDGLMIENYHTFYYYFFFLLLTESTNFTINKFSF